MNNLELDSILESDYKAKQKYMGTFMLDQLPEIIPVSKMLIVNESAESDADGGSHWLCLHRPTNFLVEFADPLNRDVKKPIVNLIHNSAPIVTYLDTNIQNFAASTCGAHVLWICICWSRGFKLHEIVDLTYNIAGGEKYYLNNDIAVRRLVENLFNLKRSSILL